MLTFYAEFSDFFHFCRFFLVKKKDFTAEKTTLSAGKVKTNSVDFLYRRLQ